MTGTTRPDSQLTMPTKSANVTKKTREKTVNDINSLLTHYQNLALAQDIYENLVDVLDHADVALGILTMGIGSKIYSLVKLCYDKTTQTIREAAEEKVITGMLHLLSYNAPTGADSETIREAEAFRIDMLKLIFNGDAATILQLEGRKISNSIAKGNLLERIIRNDFFIQLARLIEAGATLNTSTASTSQGNKFVSIASYADSIAPGWLDKPLDLGDDSNWTRRTYLEALTKSKQQGQLPHIDAIAPTPFSIHNDEDAIVHRSRGVTFAYDQEPDAGLTTTRRRILPDRRQARETKDVRLNANRLVNC
jgi:hypothetical protein